MIGIWSTNNHSIWRKSTKRSWLEVHHDNYWTFHFFDGNKLLKTRSNLTDFSNNIDLFTVEFFWFRMLSIRIINTFHTSTISPILMSTRAKSSGPISPGSFLGYYFLGFFSSFFGFYPSGLFYSFFSFFYFFVFFYFYCFPSSSFFYIFSYSFTFVTSTFFGCSFCFFWTDFVSFETSPPVFASRRAISWSSRPNVLLKFYIPKS